MAELNEFANNLERELTCSICAEIFTNPKTLKCLHSFCLKCISDWNASCRRERRPLTCPLCKSIEGLEGNDVSSLPSSFHLQPQLQLLHDMRISADSREQQELPDCVSCKTQMKLVAFCPQCQGLICASCVKLHQTITGLKDNHQATKFSDFKKENINSYVKNRMHCQKRYHDNNKLDFYCTTCKERICCVCNGTEHKLHHTVTVEEAAEEVKMFIIRDMDRVNEVKENYEKELKTSKQNMTRIEQETNAAIKEVTDEVEKHIKVLREHKAAVIETLQTKLQQQKTQNDEEQREIRDGIERLSEFNLRGQTLLDENVAHFIVKSQHDLSQRCETLREKPSVLNSKSIKRNASVRYTHNQQVTQALQNIGTIVESVTDPSCCSIESLNDIRCGFVNRFEVVTRNSQKEPCVTCQGSIDVQIQDGDGINVEKEVSQSDTGKYTVTYRAEKPCDYTIHVRIGGQKINNSPQTVKTSDVRDELKPVKTFGEKLSRIGQLNRPLSLAVSDRGEVAIADYGNHRIVIFSVDGECLRRFGDKGTGGGQLTDPIGVVFNKDRLLVTDNNDGNGRLQEFDLNGTYCRTIYKQQGVRLFGMCSAHENIAVCYEIQNRRQSGINVFNKQSGELMQEIPVNYNVPFYITYGNGKYFLSNIIKHHIGVYDNNGGFLYKFGNFGNGDGQFNDPRGLAAISDVILVCDARNDRVQMLNQDGQFIRSFGVSGSGLVQMNFPVDITVAPDGRVFVLEWGNSRVHVWR
ncbi:E3 ubiquitin-protein ligase TRIM71-like [Exaiptasia diaphana]|uniref:Uncharacterized protein n=1 Tax=Exaiptasia diaphana TaxID=2652724 RepID=A0A913XBY2_EXADI|nr:E3 ubiquitin-protein ligase TRIM71-like [Exaiptasia diaphana]